MKELLELNRAAKSNAASLLLVEMITNSDYPQRSLSP